MKVGAVIKLIPGGIKKAAKANSVGQLIGALIVVFISALAFVHDRTAIVPKDEEVVVVTYDEKFEKCVLAYSDSIKPDDPLGVDKLQRTLNGVFLDDQVALETDGKRGPLTRNLEKQFSFENHNLSGLNADDAAFRVELSRAYHRISPEKAPCTIHTAEI